MSSPFRLRAALCASSLLIAALPLHAEAAQPVPLRYGWKAGQKLAFEVEVVADRGDETETLAGTVVYTVQSVAADGAKLAQSEKHLVSKTVAADPPPGQIRRRFGPRTPPRVPRLAGFAGHDMTLDDRGRVVTQRGDSQLPYALGNLAQLIFEPLPEGRDKTWNRNETTAIRITSDWPPRSPFREPDEKERLNAEETTTFTVQDVTFDAVEIEKNYRLQTVEKTADGPRMEFSGSGTWVFDTAAKLPQSLDYKAEFIVREENREVVFPITVKFRRLSDAEYAALARQRQAAPHGEDREQRLSDLKSGDKNRGRTAMFALQDKVPEQPDAEMAAALALWLGSDDQPLRSMAARALETWATADTAASLRSALDDDMPIVVNSAARGLGRLKDADAIEPLVKLLAGQQSRLAASAALQQFGRAAETQVAKALEHDDWYVRLEATRILKVIGTSKSAAALDETAQGDANALVKRTAREALDEIRKRAETPDTYLTMRMWPQRGTKGAKRKE